MQNDVTVNPFSEFCCVWHLSLVPTMALLQPVGVLLTDRRGPVGGGMGPTHGRETPTGHPTQRSPWGNSGGVTLWQSLEPTEE